MSPVNKKKEMAAALKYDFNQDEAPNVLAKGYGDTAKRIVEKAEEAEIPTYKDEKLAKQLMNLSIGQEIPPDLYKVVAEVLSFVINMDELRGSEDESI